MPFEPDRNLSSTRQDVRVDHGLSALLAIQCLTLFVAIPLGAGHAWGRVLLDGCHLGFAAVSIAVLTRHRGLQLTLLAAVVLLFVGPLLSRDAAIVAGDRRAWMNEGIAFVALCFNGLVSALIARHVFGARRVTVHRVQGAILLYLNVAALFSIAYNSVELHWPGAIVGTTGGALPTGPGMRVAQLAYFSLSTITTTGFGDLVPVHPLVRSLASLEAVFGQLFPATLLARLVALHLREHPTATAASATGRPDDAPARARRSRAPPADHRAIDRRSAPAGTPRSAPRSRAGPRSTASRRSP